MTEHKHESEETVEDTAARIEADTASDTATEASGKHAAADEHRNCRGSRSLGTG